MLKKLPQVSLIGTKRKERRGGTAEEKGVVNEVNASSLQVELSN